MEIKGRMDDDGGYLIIFFSVNNIFEFENEGNFKYSRVAYLGLICLVKDI